MLTRNNRCRRRGTVLPLLAICCVALVGFVGFCVDLGLVMVAHTDCQTAADAAAMAGARRLTGTGDFGVDDAPLKAKEAMGNNKVLSTPIDPDDQDTPELGSYVYVYNSSDTSKEKFEVHIPRQTDEETGELEPWSACRATVSSSVPTFFGRVWTTNPFNTNATATAVHRPRDVAIVLDFSGSMRFDSLLGIPYFLDSNNLRRTNNPETVFPKFGHYDTANSGSTVTLQGPDTATTIGAQTYGPANITVETATGLPIVDDFYVELNDTTKAFTSANDSYQDTPAGDRFLKANLNGGTAFTQTVRELLNETSSSNVKNRRKSGGSGTNSAFQYAASWEANGHQDSNLTSAQASWSGYTQGPRHWGKTFFIWPPDPRSDNDWRKRFFLYPDGTTPMDDNSRLWTSGTSSSAGYWQSPGNNYRINYQAILQWLLDENPNPFPSSLRAGRILYYDAFPDTGDSTLNNRFWTTFPLTDPNERFWKEYIDYVLGVWQTGSSSWFTYTDTSVSPQVTYRSITALSGYGDDFTWGSVRITAKSTIDSTNDPDTGQPIPEEERAYMDYRDNPRRPQLHFWFGPMTMIDFLGNYVLGNFSTTTSNRGNTADPNTTYGTFWWWPGTCHEGPLWACKVGMKGAIDDIEKNHPNDFVSTMYFSTPRHEGLGRFNRVRGPLNNKYTRKVKALYYPPEVIDEDGAVSGEVRIFRDSGNRAADNSMEAPRGQGGTGAHFGFMLAYNQFSNNASLREYYSSPAPKGEAGGMGRRGAQKLIIFLTDGVANVKLDGAEDLWVNGGEQASYYDILANGMDSVDIFGEGPPHDSLIATVTRICADSKSDLKGLSVGNKPVLIHCLGFGTMFDPDVDDTSRPDALALLQKIQYLGKVQSDEDTALPDAKRIYGTPAQRVEKLQNAFYLIMQSGIQVSLVE